MLLVDLILETVYVLDNQSETVYVKEKVENAAALVVEKTMPSDVHNAYGHIFNGECVVSNSNK